MSIYIYVSFLNYSHEFMILCVYSQDVVQHTGYNIQNDEIYKYTEYLIILSYVVYSFVLLLRIFKIVKNLRFNTDRRAHNKSEYN